MKNSTKKFNKSKNKKKLFRRKIAFLTIVCTFSLIFVGIFRVVYIKAAKGKKYEKSAIENQVNKVQDKVINPNRGDILDRNNQTLAISSTVYNIALDIRNIILEKPENQEKLIKILAEYLAIDTEKLKGYFVLDSNGNLKKENDTHWKIIKKKVPYSLGKELEKKLSSAHIRGVYLEEDSLREYPFKNFASHVIGFIMGDTSWGLESFYNDEMIGTPGRVYRTYEANNFIVTRDIPPIKGNTIVSTIDSTIQQFSEDIVKKTYIEASPEHTPVVTSLTVINPNTGEILAMAQYPNYDLNNPLNFSLLEDVNYKKNFDSLSDDEQMKIRNSIWKNFVISDTFEPGSTFKVVLVAAALEENVITPEDTFFCTGYRNIAGFRIRCHKRDGHGQVNVEQALAQSCNMAMIDIANKLGKEKFYKYQREFGFGEKTGIDLFGEVDAANLMYPIEMLKTAELATSSFGQGFNSTTIQMLMAFAATINNGNVMKPYLVSQVINENNEIIHENSPKIIRKVISQETSEYLKKALITTVSPYGTAKKGVIPGYSLAGKTGTAQQGVRADNVYTLSFAAFLPAEDPQYLALAVIHKPAKYFDGSVSPVPMIKQLFTDIIDYKSIPPSKITEIAENTTLDSNEIILKDYSNKSLKETIKELNKLGIKYQIVGSGGDTVTKHFPIANTKFSKDGEILIYTETKNKQNLVVVPELLNLDVNEAKAILVKLGLDIYVEEIENNQKDIETTKKSTKVELATEIESETNNLPAIEKIEENVEQISENKNIKKVFEQLPQPGVYVEKGTVLNVKIK